MRRLCIGILLVSCGCFPHFLLNNFHLKNTYTTKIRVISDAINNKVNGFLCIYVPYFPFYKTQPPANGSFPKRSHKLHWCARYCCSFGKRYKTILKTSSQERAAKIHVRADNPRALASVLASRGLLFLLASSTGAHLRVCAGSVTSYRSCPIVSMLSDSHSLVRFKQLST